MSYRILVAEDDADILELVKLYLESSGYQVFVASNGEQAYRIIGSEKSTLRCWIS